MDKATVSPASEGRYAPSATGHSWRERTNTPWAVVLVSILAALLFVAVTLYTQIKTPTMKRRTAIHLLVGKPAVYSLLVHAGNVFSDPQKTPPSLVIYPNVGADGQFFYRLALDPFSTRRTQQGIKFDGASYRQQRIVYPLIVWAASLGGKPILVPGMLLLINLVAFGAIAWTAGAIARSLGQHALWGIIIPLTPGFLFTFQYDTSELVNAAFLLSAVWSLRQKRPVAATALLTLSILARETSLVFAAAAFLVWVWESRKNIQPRIIQWYVFAIPFVAEIAWQLMLKARYGILPSKQGGGNIGLPFIGFLHLVKQTATMTNSYQALMFVECVFFAVYASVILSCLRASAAQNYEKVAWLLFALLSFTLTKVVWDTDEDFLRTASPLCVMSGLMLLGIRKPAVRTVLVTSSAALWLVVAFRAISFW